MMSPTISSTSSTADTTSMEEDSQKKSTRVLCSHCEKILVPIEEEITIEQEPKPKSIPTMPLPPSTEMKPKNEFVTATIGK